MHAQNSVTDSSSLSGSSFTSQPSPLSEERIDTLISFNLRRDSSTKSAAKHEPDPLDWRPNAETKEQIKRGCDQTSELKEKPDTHDLEQNRSAKQITQSAIGSEEVGGQETGRKSSWQFPKFDLFYGSLSTMWIAIGTMNIASHHPGAAALNFVAAACWGLLAYAKGRS